ncbi:MAG: DUF4230 domain-containing protein [Anaerolineales bacterium]|nr:DUF4230 domain-containing protein [Anaerolineales bacterium]
MDNTKGWILVIGILLLIAITAFAMIWTMYLSIQKTVEPVTSMTGNLGTRVAAILDPTPTVLPDPITIIRDVRSLARLETIQYTIEKVITAETNQGAFGMLFGDKLIFVAHGQVIAGVDLSKLGADDLELKNGILYVYLPEPEIFISALDNEKSYVYDRDTGLLTKGDINLESTARQVAEDEIEKAAIEDGVLDLARQNAENYLGRLLGDLGYADVIFVGGTPTPTP